MLLASERQSREAALRVRLAARFPDRFHASVVPVIADEVWQLFALADEEYSIHDLAPTLGPVRPPFPTMWVEGRFPSRIIVPGLGDIPSPFRYSGALVTSGPSKLAHLPVRGEKHSVTTNVDDAMMFLLEGYQDQVALVFGVVEDNYRKLHEFRASFGFASHDGRFEVTPSEESWRIWGPDEPDLLQGLGICTLNPLLLTMSFMHCKNVRMEEEPVPPALARANARRGHPEPFATWHRLRVPSLNEGLRAAHNSRGAVLPLHLVRGHFKTYTEEKPLFGKLTGTWWWNWAAKGSAEAGTRGHTYDVGIPEETKKSSAKPCKSH